MDLIQFIERVIAKVHDTNIPDIRNENEIILQSDRRTITSHLELLLQLANHKGTKFWRTPNSYFASSWNLVVPLIKKHDPQFFDEFKNEDQAREELKEILGKK